MKNWSGKFIIVGDKSQYVTPRQAEHFEERRLMIFDQISLMEHSKIQQKKYLKHINLEPFTQTVGPGFKATL